jgi:ubiquinone/menaquinone biosynthesis C-methylase UbiE
VSSTSAVAEVPPLVPALRRCGEHGTALGVDVSFEMVRQTSGLLTTLGSPAGGVLQASAAAVPVAGQTVDRSLCAFTVFWLSDPDACFEEMRRVVKQGGVVGVSMTSAGDDRCCGQRTEVASRHR